MAELMIAMEPNNMERTFKKKGMMMPDIATPDMDVLKEYLQKMKEYLAKIEGLVGGEEMQTEIETPDEETEEVEEEEVEE